MSPPRLLVANRGDVAVRVLRTAAALGLATVAPDDDAGALHVRRADSWVRLPGTGPAAYLDVAAVVGAARQAGADALHPGWGFLAESPDLARACADAGITFVGPDPAVLALFGDKTAARARAVERGVPVLAATGADPGPEDAAAFLGGGPAMVKALAGGGGRGVRPVHDVADLPAVLERCRSEARTAFGNDAVYLERLLTGARHVEVQVAGDGAAVVALGDRDCSLQRRRQKLVEIAPAPALDDALRARLAAHATALCGSASYRGLATVEFLVRGGEVAFLEVNPRLQVEHTVTEEVTGLDLVEVALRLAGGATLAELELVTRRPRAGSPSRRGSTPRRCCPTAPCSRPPGCWGASSRPPAAACAWTPPPSPAARSARATTRCWPRWSCTTATCRGRWPGRRGRWPSSTSPASPPTATCSPRCSRCPSRPPGGPPPTWSTPASPTSCPTARPSRRRPWTACCR